MKKYFYFRDEADEDNDDDVSSSITVPVTNISGVVPTSITNLDLYYKSGDKTAPNTTGGTGGVGKVSLTCTRGKLLEVMAEIASHANSTKPSNAGLITMCDDATTGYDDEAQTAFHFSSNVTACDIAV